MNFKKLYLTLTTLTLFLTISVNAQVNTYSITSGELLFQKANIEYTGAFQSMNTMSEISSNPVRFSCFFHVGEYYHIDFSDFLGIYTGAAIRNVGFTLNEKLDLNDGNGLQDYKIVRRTYSLGIPIALKLGSFNNHTYIYAGGEYELAFAFKEKYWNSHSRDGVKKKTTKFFGDQTERFIPSVFAGVQFPGGINVKLKYYMNSFVNTDYTSNNSISDLTRYESAEVYYISISWQFKTEKLKNKAWGSDEKFSSL